MNTNTFKSYSSKASAVKGAKRANVGIAEVQEVDGKWGYYLEPQETQETEVETPAAPALLSAPAAVVEMDYQALRDAVVRLLAAARDRHTSLIAEAATPGGMP